MNQVKIIKKYCHLAIMLLLAGCGRTDQQNVIYVNSYHPGYKPGDDITNGIKETLAAGRYDLEIFYLDSKRLSGDLLKQRTDSIMEIITAREPNILIVSDDYAVKCLAESFLKDKGMPVVFCGVIRKPVFTCDDFMMDFCVLGFTKVSREQGVWAAQTAIDILDGKKPSEIPYTRNLQKEIWFNRSLAGKIGFSPDSLWSIKANIINPK